MWFCPFIDFYCRFWILMTHVALSWPLDPEGRDDSSTNRPVCQLAVSLRTGVSRRVTQGPAPLLWFTPSLWPSSLFPARTSGPYIHWRHYEIATVLCRSLIHENTRTIVSCLEITTNTNRKADCISCCLLADWGLRKLLRAPQRICTAKIKQR